MADSDIAKVGSFYLRRVTSQESEKKRNKAKEKEDHIQEGSLYA